MVKYAEDFDIFLAGVHRSGTCKGFDTYGPFKLVGGIKKGHPTQTEINGAVKFFEALYNNSFHQQE